MSIPTMVLGALLCLTVQPPTDTEDEPTVAQLVADLDHDDASRRQAAEEALIARGPDVLRSLPRVNAQTSEQVRSRLVRIRRALQQTAADQSAKPSLVTLQGDVALSRALAALAEQTGNRVQDYREQFGQPGSDPTITLDLQNVPFWEAVDAILDAADLSLYAFSGRPDVLAVVARPEGQADASDRVAYGGLFRFEPLRVESVRSLRSPNVTALRLSMEVMWEPKSAPLTITYQPAEFEARDEQGRMLSISDMRELVELPVPPTSSVVEVTVPFELPDRTVGQIESLRGELSAALIGQMSTFEFAELGKGPQSESQSGVDIVLQQARQVGQLIDIRLLIRIENADDALRSDHSWIYNNPAVLVDANGKRFEHVGMEAHSERPDEIGISYKFDPGAGSVSDYRFEYRTPAVVATRTFPFEIRTVELP